MQHVYFKRNQQRGLPGYAHLWMGRIIILLGVVNGGLGIRLVGDKNGKWSRIYVGVAAAMGVVYCLVIFSTAIRARRKQPKKIAITRY